MTWCDRASWRQLGFSGRVEVLGFDLKATVSGLTEEHALISSMPPRALVKRLLCAVRMLSVLAVNPKALKT